MNTFSITKMALRRISALKVHSSFQLRIFLKAVETLLLDKKPPQWRAHYLQNHILNKGALVHDFPPVYYTVLKTYLVYQINFCQLLKACFCKIRKRYSKFQMLKISTQRNKTLYNRSPLNQKTKEELGPNQAITINQQIKGEQYL